MVHDDAALLVFDDLDQPHSDLAGRLVLGDAGCWHHQQLDNLAAAGLRCPAIENGHLLCRIRQLWRARQ